MPSFRVALPPDSFLKTTNNVCFPANLKDLLFRSLRLSGEFEDLIDLCEELSLECPCSKFISLQEADSLTKKARLLAVPVRRQPHLAVSIESWTPDQMVIRLLADLSDDGSEKTAVCHVQFDKDVDSFTVDRLDDKESQIVLFPDYEDVDGTTELRLSLISALASVVRGPQQQGTSSFVCLDDAAQGAKLAISNKTADRQSYIMPFWFGQLMSVWLSNVLRVHVLCNAALPARVERPFALDTVYFIAPTQNKDCSMFMYLHQSTSRCICSGGAPSGAQPMFRLSFCGTCFNGVCYRHGAISVRESIASNVFPNKRICTYGLSLQAICKHDGDPDAFKRARVLLTKPDSFLSAACAIACELSLKAHDAKDSLRELLLDAYNDVLQSGSRLMTDEVQLKQSDITMETMIRSNMFTRRRKRSSSELHIVRKDGAAVRSHERALTSTHSHLLG